MKNSEWANSLEELLIISLWITGSPMNYYESLFKKLISVVFVSIIWMCATKFLTQTAVFALIIRQVWFAANLKCKFFHWFQKHLSSHATLLLFWLLHSISLKIFLISPLHHFCFLVSKGYHSLSNHHNIPIKQAIRRISSVCKLKSIQRDQDHIQIVLWLNKTYFGSIPLKR